MLEHVPQWLGRAIRGLRAGPEKLTIADPALGSGFTAIRLGSPAFADGARLPERFTADGEGVSPPLLWNDVPTEARALALIVEDPDAPFAQPLVHAIVTGIEPGAGMLAEGAIAPDGDGTPDGRDVGRNSYFREGWLPPDPPTGHGPHSYVFQLFALSEPIDPGASPGRSGLIAAMEGKVLAAGVLTGTYSRGEEAPVGPVGSALPA